MLNIIRSAIASLSAQDRTTLRLKGVTRIPTDVYLAVPNPPPPEEMLQSA
jgi:hypothetical protein